MPTTSKAVQTAEELREEFEALRNEVTEVLSMLKEQGKEGAEKITDKVEAELEEYKEKAREGLEAAYEQGGEGLEEIGERIRKNPVASLLIAFGAGYVISKILDKR